VIDGSRSVDHADAVAGRQAGAGPHLRLVALRDLQGEARGDEPALPGREGEGLVGSQIEPRRPLGLVAGKLERRPARAYPLDLEDGGHGF